MCDITRYNCNNDLKEVLFLKDNKVIGGIIGLIILSCMSILNVNIIFTKEAITAKLLAGGSLILLLILIIPSCGQIFKYLKLKQMSQ